MKIILFSLIITTAIFQKSYSQQYNWHELSGKTNHVVSLSYGLDYGMTTCLGYGYSSSVAGLPLVLAVDYSFPSGNKLFDDFKVHTGFHICSPTFDNFRAIGKLCADFRRLESDYTRQFNFGSDASLVAGYFPSSFFVAAEFGFDKAIVSYIKHKEMYLEIYPEAKSGWYIPMGGNYYYGLQTGYSFGRLSFILRVGQTKAETNFDENFLPYYLTLGVNFRIGEERWNAGE
ncbi:MAG TPA: hypothetical protein VLX91_04275 [Candidatus Acidoferrales bacterium]|nr:hypothetical protein [Candidatus Acidoferrales bacterium]